MHVCPLASKANPSRDATKHTSQVMSAAASAAALCEVDVTKWKKLHTLN